MNRRDFLDTLELVNPALARDNAVPIFSNFCFNGSTVFAYNDKIGVVAPFDGVADSYAVNGKVLMDLLRASAAKEVELSKEKETLLLKAGRSRIKLPYLESASFLFDEPEKEQWDLIANIDPHFLKGLELCLVTASNDNTMAAFMGVTVKTGKQNYLYSTDADALSRYTLASPPSSGIVQYTMPTEFCEALLRIADNTESRDGLIYINSRWAFAEFGNNFKVYGRIIEDPEPTDFENEIQRNLSGIKNFSEIPEQLMGALDRARVVGDPENKATSVKVSGGELILETDTTLGIVKDKVGFDKSHADIEVNVSARLVSRTIKITDEMVILPDTTAYKKGDDLLVLISNYDDS